MCNWRRWAFLPPIPWATPKRLVLNRVKACNFSKNRLQRCCFPINIPKFLRTSILKNISEKLLLNRIWKRCRKYPYEWLKKDLAAQEEAFKFFSSTFYEISVLCNTAIALICSKFVKYFRFSHVFVTLLLKRISPVKIKHIIKAKESNPFEWLILTNLYSNESQSCFV